VPPTDFFTPPPGHSGSTGAMPHILKMWGLLALIVLLASASRLMQWQYPDPDDVLRLVQVRDLLAGQGWFDLDQHRIDPLRDVPMHWSRLVDLPLAIAIGGLTPIFGQATAEAIALIAIPLLTLLVAMGFVGLVAIRVLGREEGGWAVLVAGILPLLMNQFQPLRIDHHGWQIACFAAALWGLSQERRRGAILAGVAMACGLMISIETLPLAGLGGAIFALRWLRDCHARQPLTDYLQALAAALIALYLATRGWPGASAFCDAITPAHLGFFLAVALGVTVLRLAPPLPLPATAGALAAIGAGGLAIFASAAPGCVGTPFGTLDPVVRDFWYVNVSEGRPIWEQQSAILVPFAQVVFAFALSIVLWARASRDTRGWWLEFVLLFAGTLALGILVARSLAFASLLATIPFAWLLGRALERLRTGGAALTKAGISLATLLVMLPAAPVALAQNFTRADPGDRPVAVINKSSCDLQNSAAKLAALPTGTVFAPLDIGPTILLETDHRVIATGHHRAESAMRDVIGGFVAPEDTSRAIVDAYGADYLVLCSDLFEPAVYARRGGKSSLAARLIAGDAPGWLEPVSVGGPDTFRVWRVAR